MPATAIATISDRSRTVLVAAISTRPTDHLQHDRRSVGEPERALQSQHTLGETGDECVEVGARHVGRCGPGPGDVAITVRRPGCDPAARSRIDAQDHVGGNPATDDPDDGNSTGDIGEPRRHPRRGLVRAEIGLRRARRGLLRQAVDEPRCPRSGRVLAVRRTSRLPTRSHRQARTVARSPSPRRQRDRRHRSPR